MLMYTVICFSPGDLHTGDGVTGWGIRSQVIPVPLASPLPRTGDPPQSYLHLAFTLVTNLRAKAAAAELDVEFEEAARTAVKSEKEDEEQRVRGRGGGRLGGRKGGPPLESLHVTLLC